MYPELFEIPFIHRPIHSFGLMMVIGFLFAFFLVRRLSRSITPNAEIITNIALCSLIAGVVGARTFHVVHYWDRFHGNLLSVFAIWKGGLEFYGGVISTIPVVVLYLWRHKLPMRRYFDILAIGLVLGLVFGRIGCFLNGCCFGKPTNLPWAVRFPYGSYAYHSQIYADPKRNRAESYLKLPDGFFGYYNQGGKTFYGLKPYEDLTSQQKEMLKANDQLRSLPVHPTQLYSSANAAFLCLILYLFWRRSQNAAESKKINALFTKPGSIFALAFILYSIARFFIEFLRDDNPFEDSWWAIYKDATVSQNLGIYMAIIGLILMIIFQRIEPHRSK